MGCCAMTELVTSGFCKANALPRVFTGTLLSPRLLPNLQLPSPGTFAFVPPVAGQKAVAHPLCCSAHTPISEGPLRNNPNWTKGKWQKQHVQCVEDKHTAFALSYLSKVCQPHKWSQSHLRVRVWPQHKRACLACILAVCERCRFCLKSYDANQLFLFGPA